MGVRGYCVIYFIECFVSICGNNLRNVPIFNVTIVEMVRGLPRDEEVRKGKKNRIYIC